MQLADDLTALDRLIGRNIRTQRLIRQLTQKHLAGRLGMSYQQLQKYERGVNRIPASRLWRIAEVLRLPVNMFFETLD